MVRLVPVQVVRNDSHLSNDSSEQISSSTSSNNWILQHNYQQPQQHHRQIHHYHQRSRSENRRPRIPWVRSKSPGRDRSYSPLRITSPTWTEPRSPITVRSGWNQELRDVGTQTMESTVGKDDGGYFEIKSYFHRSKIYINKNKKFSDVTIQVTGHTAEPAESKAPVTRKDSLFRRIRNLSAEVQEIQDIVDSRQVTKSQRHSAPAEDTVDYNYISSVDTLLNEKNPQPRPQSHLHTSEMRHTEGTVKVSVGDYRKKGVENQQNQNSRNRHNVQNGSVRSFQIQNGAYYQSPLSKSSPTPAVFVTPPTPETVGITGAPSSRITFKQCLRKLWTCKKCSRWRFRWLSGQCTVSTESEISGWIPSLECRTQIYFKSYWLQYPKQYSKSHWIQYTKWYSKSI